MARLFVGERDSAEVSVGKVTECGVLERVIAIPLDYGPVKLLPPASRQCEPGGAGGTEGRNRRWMQEVTLKISVWEKLLQCLRHVLSVEWAFLPFQ